MESEEALSEELYLSLYYVRDNNGVSPIYLHSHSAFMLVESISAEESFSVCITLWAALH